LKTPRVASLVGSFSITLSILLIGILLIGSAACLPIRHVNYDLASKDPTAVESLYQQLTEWINTSLAYCSEEQFSNASEELDSYSKFVFELSLFREDIESRGIDAVILQPEYSTDALCALGQATRPTIDDTEGANQSLRLARVARQRGHIAELWVETLRARSYLRGLQADLDRLESSIRGLPDFIDRADLTLRVLDLRAVLDRYNAMLAELSSSASNITTATILGPQGRNGTATTIELSARPTVVRAGEKVRFDGLLRGQDGQGIPGQEVEILFLSETRRATTDLNGSFTVGWTIPYAVDPGTHWARAIFNPPNASDLLPSSSNKVYVTILGRERSPTTIDIHLSPNPLVLGQTLRVWGRLADLWGGGLVNKTIRIVSPNLTAVTGIKTRDDGSYSANITVSLVGRLVLQSRFEGDSLYKPSTSQQAWIDVVAERTVPLATKLTLKGPAKASVLQPIHLSGRLSDSLGKGIAGKNVTIVWDAVPLLVVVTGQDGGFSATTKAPLASPGIHRVFAIFSSGDGEYLSSQSDELLIRLYASIGPWREIGIGTAAIVAMLSGIAVARGRTPPFSRERVPQKKVRRTGERPRIQEAVPTAAAVELHPETPTRRSILDNLPPELKGRELILRLYTWMLDFLARTYSFDPTSMTHTEILSSLLSRGLPPQGATAARSLTRIYEKAAYSGEESTGADEEQFVHAVELLHSIITERER